MDEEGELKKRIDENAATISLEEVPYPLRPKLVNVFNNMRNNVDEAKKDYPSLESLGMVPKLTTDDILTVSLARHEWYKKWFGDSP